MRGERNAEDEALNSAPPHEKLFCANVTLPVASPTNSASIAIVSTTAILVLPQPSNPR
jgi:hypothetical protein